MCLFVCVCMCVYVCVFANPGPVDDYFKGIESPTTLFPRFRPPEVGWGGVGQLNIEIVEVGRWKVGLKKRKANFPTLPSIYNGLLAIGSRPIRPIC